MKRILAVTLTIVMLLATLTGCMASQNPSESENTDKADIPTGSTVKRVWDRHHPDDSERSPYFSIFVPELNDTLITFRENFKIYMDNEYLLGGPGHGCESFYLSDLTGDGKPELCFGMNFGSGFTDLRIQIFDYETRECIYTLSDRGFHDYYIFVRNGDLCIKETEYMKQEAVRTGVLSYDGAEINVSWDTEIDATVDRDKRNSITMTIAETLPSCAAFEYQPGAPYCFYAFDSDGKLYRVLWTDWNNLNENDKIVVEYSDIKMFTYPEPTTGWNPQYEITALSVEKRINADESLVSHIQIKSGDNTIHPFGCMTWSKTDNGDGTFTESIVDKYDVVDLVSGKTTFSAEDIPRIVLNESVSYLVQVNGRVEKVYLLTPSGDTYTKSETTFDALSTLADGTYYVAFEVLLSGNCDPNAPQNSYRYEDVFCLVVGEQKPTNQNSILIESLNFSQYLNDVNFVPGLSQGSFIHKVEGYAYNDTAVTDIIAGMNYDGPSGGGWQATGDLFGFYNDYKVTDDEKYANYSNSLYSNVQLKGLPLPYNIKFGDSLDDVFEVIGIGLDQYGNFTPDKNSDTDITLYSNDTETLLFQNLKLTKEPVDYEFPFVLTYTETYNVQQDGGKSIVVHRVIKLSFDDDANFGLVEISVNETRELE